MRLFRVMLYAVSLFSVLACSTVTYGQAYPPNAKVYGKSLTRWMLEHTAWTVLQGWPSNIYQPGPSPIAFLPYPAVVDLTVTDDGTLVIIREQELTVAPGTAMVVPINLAFFENYADGSQDPVIFGIDHYPGSNTEPEVTLDGRPLLSSYEAYRTEGPYDPPLIYPQPTSYGSIGAFWGGGVGCVIRPLEPGTHTLHALLATDWLRTAYYIFEMTWVIRVAPLGKR